MFFFSSPPPSCRALFLLKIMVRLLPVRSSVARHFFILLDRHCLLPSVLPFCHVAALQVRTHSPSAPSYVCVMLVTQTLSPAACSLRYSFSCSSFHSVNHSHSRPCHTWDPVSYSTCAGDVIFFLSLDEFDLFSLFVFVCFVSVSPSSSSSDSCPSIASI